MVADINVKQIFFFQFAINLAKSAAFLFLFLLFFSCSNTKYLPEGEQLYTGASIKIISNEKLIGENVLKKQAKKAIKPKPNASFLGLRIKLWIYNIAPSTTKEKGFKYWLKNKVGEPPVFFSDVNPTATSEFINARLYNKGFFKSNVSFETILNKENNKASIVYSAFVQKPFTINTIDYGTISDTAIAKIIQNTFSKSLLKKGYTYDLDLLRSERTRIDGELKNNGFYYFSPDYLYFKIDTSSKETNLDIFLSIKSNTPAKALLPYKIGEIMIKVDSTDLKHSAIIDPDTLKKGKVHFVKSNPDFRPWPIIRAIFMAEGSTYSRQEHNQTLGRLGSLGVFKFVNIRISEDSTRSQCLKVAIDLDPLPQKTLSVEFEAATKSNNFIGPSANLGFMHRNTFGGAEKLNISLHGSVETQFNGEFRGLYTYEIGPQIKYTLPKFLLPFKARVPRISAPTTQFLIDYTYSKRVNYFDLNSLKFAEEYRWKETITKEHVVSPINVTYLNINNISADFSKILDVNPFLKQRYEDQLIELCSYSFTYNEQVYDNKKNQIYFNGSVEVAGGTANLLNKIFKPNDGDNPRKIIGVNYAEYVRFDVDLRDYYNIDFKTKLASRLIVGVGIPHGNSNALPYIKGFFAGGTNSLRAFPINSVGPGTYQLPDSLLSSFFLQQGGDLKLEWNLEYRFPIIGFLKGALFVDVGNTWLMRENPLLPGGKFEIGNFYKQFAVGTGFGLRADFNFFVIRLDLGIPLRKPSLPLGQEWVIEKIQPSNGAWRGQNLILNIAIGYPF
ncbi:MAG: BamA/TamA family outer membrane protein [Cytophagales bacterium]